MNTLKISLQKPKDQLVAFASSKDYKNFMIAKAKEAEALEDSVLYVRKRRSCLAEDLKKAYGHKIDVEESKGSCDWWFHY